MEQTSLRPTQPDKSGSRCQKDGGGCKCSLAPGAEIQGRGQKLKTRQSRHSRHDGCLLRAMKPPRIALRVFASKVLHASYHRERAHRAQLHRLFRDLGSSPAVAERSSTHRTRKLCCAFGCPWLRAYSSLGCRVSISHERFEGAPSFRCCCER